MNVRPGRGCASDGPASERAGEIRPTRSLSEREWRTLIRVKAKDRHARHNAPFGAHARQPLAALGRSHNSN